MQDYQKTKEETQNQDLDNPFANTQIIEVNLIKNRNGFSHIGTSDWYYTTKARPLQGFHVKQRVLFLEICGCGIWPYHILWRRFRVSHETTFGCFSGVFHMKHRMARRCRRAIPCDEKRRIC